MKTRKLNRPRGLSLALLVLTSLVITPFAAGFNFALAQDPGAPANDNLAAAARMDGDAGSLNTTNVGATPDDENATGGNTSIWYYYQPSKVGVATISTEGSDFDTTLTAYVATGSGQPTTSNLEQLAFSDDDNGMTSRIKFNVEADRTYYIAVSGYGDNAGGVSLGWSLADPPVRPANDDFANATDIGGAPQGTVDGGNNEAASAQVGEPEHDGDGAYRSIWFKWTAPSDGYMRFDANDSDFEVNMGVYVGEGVDALTTVADNGRMSDAVDFFTTEGTVYHIAVDGDDDDDFGNVVLNWQAVAPPVVPANDNFANGEDITDASGSVTRSTANATRETGEPYHTAIGQDPDAYGLDLHPQTIWFDYTPTETGSVAFDTLQTQCPDGGNCQASQLAVYTGDSLDNLTEVASNDDADPDYNNGQFTAGSRVFFNAVAGTTYRIVLADKSEDGLDYTLTWQPFTIPVPANDDFAQARDITAPGSFEATNKFASVESGEPQHAGEPAFASVWFRYTAASSGGTFVKIDSALVNNRAFSPRVAVYTGNSLDALTPIASKSADASPGFNGVATIGFQAVGGRTYYIAVDGQRTDRFGQSYTNSAGRFILTLGNDTTAPTSTAQTFSQPNANGFYKGAGVSVSIGASDNQNGSGVRDIKYTLRINGVDGAQQTVSPNGTFFTVRTEGETVISYFATDNAGNTEAPAKTLTIKIDRTAPVTTATASGLNNNNGYYRSDVSVALNAIDSYSGADSITYNVNGGTSVTASGASKTVVVTAEGANTISYFATDKAGNAEAARTITVNIDKTAPGATTATANSTPNSSGYYNGANGAGAKVTLAAIDSRSGIAGYYVTATGAQTYSRRFVPASNPIVNLADGTTTLTFNAVDNAGNEGVTATRTYKVDQTAPVTSYTVSSQGRNITLTVNFRDNLSGYAAVTSSVNNGAPQTHRFQNPTTNGSISYTFNGPYNDHGDYTVKYYGTDVAGNREAEKSVTFRIPPAAITPFASAPVRNANGTYTVTFGYQNDNPTTFNIAAGASNFFSPNPQNRNQTTAFQPGRVANAFGVTWNGSRLTWTIKGPDGQTRAVSVR